MLPPDSLVLDGRFRVLRAIGSGGMGEVYLGEQVSLGRKVAIKVLHHDLHLQPGMAERFKREARLLSAVEHPAVVRIIDFGESGDAACLVMELVEGESLFELLRAGPLAPARALTVLQQLAEGLAAIHDKGIIHRDLKPENVFLTRTARGEQARLLDFGIARLIEPEADSNVSQVGVVLGTPEYLSPEQAIGARVDARSDLYCFGVLAYRVLSGRLPFDGPDPRKYIAQHANAAPLPLAEAAPGLAQHPTLVALVMRLLEKDPANRFQSAHALADALTEAATYPLPESGIALEAPAPAVDPPISSGTAAFGVAPAVPSMGVTPQGVPPTGSGTAIFGVDVTAPVPEQPTGASGSASVASPEISVPWDVPSGELPPVPPVGVAAPAPAIPPPTGSGTVLYGTPREAPPPQPSPSPRTEKPSSLAEVSTGGAQVQGFARLASTRTRQLLGLGLAGCLLLAGGVGLWLRSRSPEVQARSLLRDGKPAEALKRLELVPPGERKAPELRQLRALALHALKRHDDEHEVLHSLEAGQHKDIEDEVLDGLAEDFGANEGDKGLHKLLGGLPKERLHQRFESLAEGDASPKQWGALRYLEASQDTEGLNLVELYTTALGSEDCGVRAKAARRLGALGSPSAVPALTKLAEQPKENPPLGARSCGQDEAAAALQTLKKSN